MTSYCNALPSTEKPWLKYYLKPVEQEFTDCSIYEFLKNHNDQESESVALNYFGKKITYKRMFSDIERIAAALQVWGVSKGDFVSVVGLNIPEFYELVYAVNKVGGVSNLIGFTSPVQDLKEQLVTTKSRFLIVVDIALERLLEASKNTEIEKIVVIPISKSMPALMKAVMAFKKVKWADTGDKVMKTWDSFLDASQLIDRKQHYFSSGDDLAVLVYTGGSTGVPKGVMLSNKNLNSYYANFNETNLQGLTDYRKGERYLAYVPFFLAFGLSACCHAPMCNSMEMILVPDPDPKAVVKIMLKSKPNHVVGGKPLLDGWSEIADNTRMDFSYIHSVMYGGESMDINWEEKIHNKLASHNMTAPVLNGYGMTETAGAALFCTPSIPGKLIPFKGVNIKITDPDDCHTEYGYEQEGELCLSGDTVMTEYYKNDEENGDTLFEDVGRKWLKTHDLAKISLDGTIIITGRIKRLYFKLSEGNILARVYPLRIEQEISKLQEIEKCAVIGVKDEKTSYRTVCYVVAGKNTFGPESNLRQKITDFCSNTLPDSHIPDEYIFVNELPLTRANKIDYKKLEANYGTKQQHTAFN